jgi:D-alanyl-lipoteichoic acid acyltransferase DltB (MBOAT superfamily)
MLFNSIEFAIFLPIVFLLYWFVFNKNIKAQNLFLVVVSYTFYGWWDWRFLSLIVFSSLVDYTAGRMIKKKDSEAITRKIWLLISIIVNLGFLGFFKYYNFFVDSFIEGFSLMGMQFQARSLNIILPVGISFYTFQTLSYTIDVYRRKLKPTNDIVAFFAFVSFFPQLVAGPIERATNLLPQFYLKRKFNLFAAKDGMRQILWGLFKKIVIADNAANYVNYIFENYNDLPATTLWLGTFYFALQIYGDFSGYSDIAIGTSRLFGFKLMRNFANPYFSRDIAEFWRRWHISLSTWFRDYLYIPLGGSRGSKFFQIRNVIIIFVVSGFWHGANWTFIAWGLLNGLYFIPLLLFNKNRKNLDVIAENSFFPNFREISGVLITFILTLLAWVFFRSETVGQAFSYIVQMFDASIMLRPTHGGIIKMIPLIGFMFIIEWFQRRQEHGLEISRIKQVWLRWSIYQSIIFVIILFGAQQQSFIYFQF